MSSDNNTRASIEEETENDDDQIRQQQHQQKKKEKEARIEFEKRLKGAKNLVMRPLRKLQKAYTRRKRRPPPAPFPYSEDLGGGGGGGSLGCHHLCFVQPRVSDPPHPDHDLPPLRTNPDAKASSYHDFLRSLLERNDFYSPECNVHREI